MIYSGNTDLCGIILLLLLLSFMKYYLVPIAGTR